MLRASCVLHIWLSKSYLISLFLPGAFAQNKAITLLTILVISFCIATIVLAVEKSSVVDDLNDCRADGTTTTTTETIPPVPQVILYWAFILKSPIFILFNI